MYVRNLKQTSILAYACKKHVARFLMKNKLSVLYRELNTFYFADTKELRELVDKVPWWVKVLDN